MPSSPERAVPSSASGRQWWPAGRAWNRRLHYYLGLYFLFFIWLFALTGLVLNHGTWIPSNQQGRVVTNNEQPIRLDVRGSPLEDARAIMQQLGIAGEIEWVATPAEPGRFNFRVNRPSMNYVVNVDRAAGRAAVQSGTINGWNATRILHTFTGVRAADARNNRDWIVTSIWAFAMDAVAVGLVAMVATSLWMWWGLRNKRVTGTVALALGCLVCGWFAFGLRWLAG